MNENISRSTIFRNKMKIEASKKQEELSSIKPKINKSVYLFANKRSRLTEENIGKEPGE